MISYVHSKVAFGLKIISGFFTDSSAITEYVQSKSTCPYEDDYWPTDSVSKLLYNPPQRLTTFLERVSKVFRSKSNKTKSTPLSVVKKGLTKASFTPSSDSTRLTPLFTNIREFSVKLPFDKHFWDFIPKLDQLVTLNVKLDIHYTDQSQLQVLLDQAPNLYSLNVVCLAISTPKFFLTDIRNASIRKLSLLAAASFHESMFYNMKQCVELSRSPLGRQCEILTIGVPNKECIVYLINEMINLRVLTVRCYDNNITNLSSAETYYDLVTWLKFSLPPAVKIAQYECCDSDIQVWIR
jgi:hypothetical protein